MRTITTTTTVYKFEELTEKAQEHVIEKLYDLNVNVPTGDIKKYGGLKP